MYFQQNMKQVIEVSMVNIFLWYWHDIKLGQLPIPYHYSLCKPYELWSNSSMKQKNQSMWAFSQKRNQQPDESQKAMQFGNKFLCPETDFLKSLRSSYLPSGKKNPTCQFLQYYTEVVMVKSVHLLFMGLDLMLWSVTLVLKTLPLIMGICLDAIISNKLF